MQFRKLFEGQASEAKAFELINRGYSPDGYSPDVFRAGDFFEIGEAEYWYFLECLPPMDFSQGGFSMCEFATGNLTNAFFERDGRFWCLTIERKSAADFASWARAFCPSEKVEA